MRKKIYYIYNPTTLNYDRVYPSLWERIFTVMRHLFMGILIGVGIFAGLNYFIDSPQEKKMKKEQEELLLQYNLMSKQLDEALTVLSDIQQRDDNLYRVLLQGASYPGHYPAVPDWEPITVIIIFPLCRMPIWLFPRQKR